MFFGRRSPESIQAGKFYENHVFVKLQLTYESDSFFGSQCGLDHIPERPCNRLDRPPQQAHTSNGEWPPLPIGYELPSYSALPPAR
jgi:hypothetical protein